MLLKQFSDFNAQHFMNLFPKVAKIARKRLFTSLSNFIVKIIKSEEKRLVQFSQEYILKEGGELKRG